MRNILAILVLSAWSANAQAATACTPADFTMSKISFSRPRPGAEIMQIRGVIHNGCGQAAAVQYKLAFYDKAGDLMHVEDQWLASITNIPANSDWPFETTISVPGFSTYTVTPIDVRAWRPR
jgi:hypothetical protein